MLEQPLNFHFFLFVIPGFITVWSFRYFIGSKEKRDFEYFALSALWGLLMFLLYSFFSKQENLVKLFENPYAAAIILSILGLIMGWLGSVLSRTKSFQKIVHWLKNFHF